MDMIEDMKEKYSVGALLYTPALNGKIAGAVADGKFGTRYSLALCLEDTISDHSVGAAEDQLVQTLRQLRDWRETRAFFLPRIFIRVRSCEQMVRLTERLTDCRDILCGFIFPKYTVSNAEEYNREMIRINERPGKKLWMMPILESGDLVDYSTRREVLRTVRERIDAVRDIVLNVRVGGNDFSNQFAARRHYDETIYDILPIAQLLGDILTVFSRDYVVSGPVWEFFSSDNEEWKRGLQNELKRDRLNGFIGKTVIHPKQIGVVNEALKVTRKDFEDAREILNWDENGLQVGKSFAGERMNEVKTHINWALKTMTLAEIYGIM